MPARNNTRLSPTNRPFLHGLQDSGRRPISSQPLWPHQPASQPCFGGARTALASTLPVAPSKRVASGGGGPCFSDKQGNNRSGFVAVVGLTVWNIVQYQGRIRPWNRAGSLDLKGKMGRRTLPAPDPALISNGSLRRKFNACNNYISVIRLFIRNVRRNRLWCRFSVRPSLGEALARAGRPEDALGVSCGVESNCRHLPRNFTNRPLCAMSRLDGATTHSRC